jgi:succinate dehydrogenase/fumarate reductase flavoprotein subunit|tara:strand:+ start:1848 stop:3560 length:1713 start_codon:yes stop_codon:yes gene_type:complete
LDTLNFDIIIVGGGAAGLRAAMSAIEYNDKLKIAIVSKVYPMRSHTVSAEGGAAAVLKDYDNLDLHCFDTIKGSDYLADQDVVEYFVNESPDEILRLEHWGCPWSRDSDGRVSSRAFGGMSVKRTVYAADKTGFHMLHSLFQRTLMYENIERFDEWFVTSLLTDKGKVTGLTAIDLKTGELNAICANSVILSTGGAGKVYKFTTNASICTGDGMALAYRAGVPMKDMEFVQFHPTLLPVNGILLTEGARGEGGYLVNKDNERFLKNYAPEKMELGPRDLLSRALLTEINEGRGFDGPYGSYIGLDLRHLGEDVIETKLPLVKEISENFAGINPSHELIPVRPGEHYSMGGISVDITGSTSVKGLFSAGESACISLNGANRLGSNSLTECLVFGAYTGRSAAEHATNSKNKSKEIDVNSLLLSEEKRIFSNLLGKEKNTEKVSVIRDEMQLNMDNLVGVFRNEEDCLKACKVISKLKSRFKKVGVSDKERPFNTELVSVLELDFMLDVAEAIAHSALNRKESRGSHYRNDYVKRNDSKFLKHSLAYKTNDGLKLKYIPVTITKWKPQERVY